MSPPAGASPARSPSARVGRSSLAAQSRTLLVLRWAPARRAVLRCLALSLLACLAFATYSGEAHAYAWMIKYGYSKCGTCHTDPSGGETLNHMGRLQSQQLLSFGGAEPDQ